MRLVSPPPCVVTQKQIATPSSHQATKSTSSGEAIVGPGTARGSVAPATSDRQDPDETHASFPGIGGALYRLLVIESRGHRAAVRRLLRWMERRAIGSR